MGDSASGRAYVARIAEVEGGYRAIVMRGDEVVHLGKVYPDPQEAKKEAALFVVLRPEEDRVLVWAETIADAGLVRCERHGPTRYSHVCRHLTSAEGLGYFALETRYPPFQAWCEACEAVRREERGWSERCEEHSASVRTCTGCYRELLTRHVFRGWDDDYWEDG